MGRNERFPEFCCRECGSPGIRIDGPLEPNAAVRCGRCDADLGDWGSFVEAAEALLGQDFLDRARRSEPVATVPAESAETGER
jgi:hypothetical protein